MTATTEPSERANDAALKAFFAFIDEHGAGSGGDGPAMQAALCAAYATDETIAALRRDAERYRWWRNRPGYVQNKSFVIDGVLEEYLDELIDTALRQAETEGGG